MVSYRHVFNPLRGNIFQMLLKLWIYPWFPKITIFVCNLLGVGVFRYVLMNTVGLLGKGSKHQTNYHIGERTMNNLLTFATNQTMFNESVHTFSLLLAIPIIFTLLWQGVAFTRLDYFLVLVTILNLYCVLLQRYNRSKLVLLIQQRLNEGDRPDGNFRNWLGLDFSRFE